MSFFIPAPITYGNKGINPNKANEINVISPLYKGLVSVSTKPSSYNIMISTNTLEFVAKRYTKRLNIFQNIYFESY